MDTSHASSRIVVVDLTCRTPPYDRELSEGLVAHGEPVELWASGCHHADALASTHVVRRSGWSDVVTDLPVQKPSLVKGLKAVEYAVNLIRLWVHMLRTPPRVVHFQWLPLLDYTTLEMIVVRSLQRAGIPVVYTVHDLLPLDDPNAEGARQRYARCYRTVDALVCHTETSQQQLQNQFGIDAEKIWRIPHGPLGMSPSTETPEEASAVVDVQPSERTVLLFGVLRPYKGYEFLLRAWTQVVQAVPDARLIIAGRASTLVQAEIEDLIDQQGIAASVSTVFRFLSDDELGALIDRADVLVYPYRNITQSGALFTGMSAEKAIVATDVGGLGETIRDGETGVLVPFDDDAALSGALARLLTDPDRREALGMAVKGDLQTRYSWKEIAHQTLRCYDDLAGPSDAGVAR
jgi:glycosyltransferase involved in cell wall biosynthesis